MTESATDTNAVELATDLTVAWLSNPNTRASPEEVPAFLARMHAALEHLWLPQPEEQAPARQEFPPAVSVRKSLASPDHIISMVDGKPYRTLRRHLSRHGLTPEQYRERYGLKPDYPMTAQSSSQERREMAHKIGLGRKSRDGAEERGADAGAPATARPASGRKKKPMLAE